MGRTTVRRSNRQRGRRRLDGMGLAAVMVVVAFALVGVASASAFVVNKVRGTSTASSPPVKSSTSALLAQQDLARAQAQATAIIRQAQSTGHTIVNNETSQARKRAKGILDTAHRRAAQVVKVATPAPAAVVPAPVVPAPVVTYATPVPIIPSTGVAGLVPAATSVVGGTGTQTGTTPNLQNVPSSWLVVGYNASFGHGPGNAGSVSVINRSAKTFSGIARVSYTSGGFATAPFSGLAPGQSLVLPLNGRTYAGGGYSIQLIGLH